MQKQAPNRLKKAYPGDFMRNIGFRQGDTRRVRHLFTHSRHTEVVVLLQHQRERKGDHYV